MVTIPMTALSVSRPRRAVHATMLLARLAWTAGWIVRHHLVARVGWQSVAVLVALSAAAGAVGYTITTAL